MTTAEEQYRSAVRELESAQARVGAIPKGDPAREEAKAVFEQAATRVREAKEAVKSDNVRRNFAGLGNTPLFLACVERFAAETIAELEERALEIQTERDEAAAARRAAKATVAPPSVHTAAVLPEIIVRSRPKTQERKIE